MQLTPYNVLVLPIGDDNWDRRRWPVVTATLVVVNVLVFLYELQLQATGPYALQTFVDRWGVVPVEYTRHTDLWPFVNGPYWSTLFTSMFLHGGWGHLLGNMLYLWIFGDNVEDRMGRIAFLGFYVVSGIVAAYAQIWAAPDARLPSVGASGAIAGVLGAYVVMFPRKRVRVLFFWVILEVPALVVIGLWAVTQLVSGVGTLTVRSATEEGGVAYMAHVGGFAAGVVGGALLRVLRPPAPPRRRVHPLFLEPGERWP